MTTIRSEQILDGTIVNVDLSATAAIAWTKISKTGAVLGDLGGTLAWTQLPTGAGDWVATPRVMGDLMVGALAGGVTYRLGLENKPPPDYERVGFRWFADVAHIGTDFGGTGLQRDFRIGGLQLRFASGTTSPTDRWLLNSNGYWIAAADNAYDIGQPAARPRRLYLAGDLTAGGAGTFGGVVSGDGSGLTNLPAANLTGTIPAAQVPAYTGDVTSPAGSTVNTLATVNANVGTFGSASQVPQLTVNAKGQVTAIANVAVSGGGAAAAGTLTGTTLAANVVFSSLTSVGTITSGTWAALFGAVSGANLTNLTAGNLVGTIPAATLAGRSLADLGTRSAGALNSGNLPWAQMPTGDGTWAAGNLGITFTTFTINGQVNHRGAFTQSEYSVIYPGGVGGTGVGDYQTSYYIAAHGAYGLFTNTGVYVTGSEYLQGSFRQSAAGALYPGGAGLGAIADFQSAFYIAAHGSYGLYINTGLYIAGQITCPAGITLSGQMYTGSSINAVGCITGHAGAGGASANVFSVYWIGTGAQLWIDTSMVGLIGLTSDRRVKQAIAPMTVGLAELLRLQPTSFEWRDAPDDPGEHYGLLAQDVAAVLPVVAMQTTMPHDLAPDGLWRVDYLALVPVLVHAVQELAAEIAALKGSHV